MNSLEICLQYNKTCMHIPARLYPLYIYSTTQGCMNSHRNVSVLFKHPKSIELFQFGLALLFLNPKLIVSVLIQ